MLQRPPPSVGFEMTPTSIKKRSSNTSQSSQNPAQIDVMDCSPASPYAAPNTPIASAKRPKIHLKARSSPKSSPKLLDTTVEGDDDAHGGEGTAASPDHEMLRKLNLRAANMNRMAMLATCTPSKNLFSPGLRVKDKDAPMPPHPGADSDEESDGIDWNNADALAADRSFSSAGQQSEDDSGLPDEEIKHVTEDSMHLSEESDSPARPLSSDAVPCEDQVVDDIYDISLDADNQGATIAVEEEPEDDTTAFNPYAFIAQLPDLSQVTRPAPAHLPPQGKIPLTTLVLDLDETLVHCTVEPVEKADVVFPVEFNGTMYKVYGRKRPYLDYFLEQVSKHFEVVLFTASQRVYADVLLDILDPEKRLIRHRLFRESCLLVQGSYLKDLTVLGRDLRKSLLVDNSPYAYGYQVDNGVPIESWYDDESDTELLKLLAFLKRVQAADDVRPLIRTHFKTYELVDAAALKAQQKEANSKKHVKVATR